MNDTPPSNFTGSADVVAGQQDAISAVAENIYDDGTHYLGDLYPGETGSAATVYVPYAVKNWFTGNGSWRQTTDLIIQNAGTQTTNVTVTFYDSWGAYSGSNTVTFYNIAPRGQLIVPGTAMNTWETGSNNSLASGVVSADQPLAVVASTLSGVTNSSGTVTTPFLVGEYRAFTSAGNTVYMPLAAVQYYNYNSSPQIQNASSGYTTFQTTFYANGNANPTLIMTTTLSGYDAINLWHPTGLPTNFLGSAVSTVLSGGPIVAMAEYDKFDTAHSQFGVMQYEGVQGSTQSNVLAYVRKTSPWTYTGIQAQNMGGTSTGITENYFMASGSGDGTSTTKTAAPNSAVNFWTTSGEEPANLDGSAVSGSNPGVSLAVQVNFDRTGDSSFMNRDGLMGYSAVK